MYINFHGISIDIHIASLAQLVERRTFNPVAAGSSPVGGIFDRKSKGAFNKRDSTLPQLHPVHNTLRIYA